jgi:hypothetical protein
LIVTNKASQPETKPTTSDSATVMTVRARGTDDEGDKRGYATAASSRLPEKPQLAAATDGGSWVQRGVLSFSVGCLGVGCFLLRIIRLGRLAGKVVSGGLQVATKLRV